MSIGARRFDVDDKRHRSRTQQAGKADADINVLMKRYQKTGVLGDPLSVRPLVFADVSNVGDFREVCSRVQVVKDAFERLPADVRKEFKHDPANVLDFLANPANADRARELDLLPPLTKEELEQRRAAAVAAAAQPGQQPGEPAQAGG